MINPATGEKFKNPFLDTNWTIPNPDSSWESIFQVYHASEEFRGYFNDRYKDLLGGRAAPLVRH